MHICEKVKSYFQHPRWIVIEGMNGCGKTTFTNVLHRTLDKELLLDCYLHKEVIPDLYDHYNKRLLDSKSTTEEQIFLALAQRLQSYTSYVAPALNKGYCVLQDRGHMSTRVYQGHLRDDGLNIIDKSLGVSDKLPAVLDHVDLVVFIDTPLNLAVSRRVKDAHAHGQSSNVERFRQIHAAYQREYEMSNKQKVLRVDGDKTTKHQISELFEKIQGLI